ncbi:hypothetical protein [Brevibacillus agri]|uniref:hypothetical protein n=1 Tax=Brevibacillus agri TaxID=51101 RepID=UPI003D1EC301
MGPNELWVDVYVAESALWNIGSAKKEFVGVGPHLFAIACKKSFDLGFGGWVAFFAKTNLIEHYVQSLRAQSIGHRIVIPPPSAFELVQALDRRMAIWETSF